jgi:hypothetical protein
MNGWPPLALEQVDEAAVEAALAALRASRGPS